MAKKDSNINPALYDIIRKPIITEKSTILGENNQLTFEVDLDANKPAIKEAVEKIFDVKVKSVNTIRQQGKTKRFRGKMGVRSDYKKAVVTLEQGQNIDVMAGA